VRAPLAEVDFFAPGAKGLDRSTGDGTSDGERLGPSPLLWTVNAFVLNPV
jgi:hypothetical protein